MLRPTLACIALVAASASFGADMCWIDAVERTGEGVLVKFSTSAPGHRQVVDGAGNQVRPSCDDDDQGHCVTAKGGATLLRVGHRVSLMNSGHDGCEISAVVEGDVPGVRARAWFGMPGQPVQTRIAFIPART